jgi:hypothetical protein
MKRKLATYFPIAVLALGLTLGMAAAFMALRPSSSVPTVSAAHSSSTQAFIVTASPATAGELAEYVFTFAVTGVQTSTVDALLANTGEIRITFDNDAQVPASIPASAVLVQASLVTGAAEIGTGGGCDDTANANAQFHSTKGADQAVPLAQSPTFDLDVDDPTRKIAIIKVPDMNPSTGTGSCGAGAQGIAAGAKVIVTFTTAAGIKNRGEASNGSDFNARACPSACVAGTNKISGSVGSATVAANANRGAGTSNEGIKERLILNAVDGQRGSNLTVVGKGFKDGTTATVWLDIGVDLDSDGLIQVTDISTVAETVIDKDACGAVNGTAETAAVGAGDGDKLDTCTGVTETSLRQDNVRSPGESDLADVTVGADDTFTATFTVNNPPFRPGKVNFIAAKDGRNNVLNANTDEPVFELRGVVTVTPTTVRLGDTITIQLKDFDANCDVKTALAVCTGYGTSSPSFRLGGVDFDKTKFSGTTTTTSVGEATFTAIVPNGVPLGAQALEVREVCCIGGGGATETRRQTLTVGGATLILTPSTVVANQTLNIVGNDFTEGGGVTINETAVTGTCTVLSSMTIQGVAIARSKINDNLVISVAAGGNWSTSVLIPVSVTTTTPGTYDLKVTDCKGREGVGAMTIPPRVVSMNPKEGQVGTDVIISGTGFPSKNDRSGSVSTTVSIKYDAGSAGGVTTISVQPDASGNITGTLRVPTNANIPSSNNVTTEFDTEAPISKVINTQVHEVPRASLTITPATGKPGTKVTAAVKGAKAFSTISSALIGASLDVRPAPTPFTDAIGNVSFDFIVPQMEVGVQNLEVKIGNTTASAAFTVEGLTTPPPPGGGPPIPVGEALVTPLATDFVRAFNFNNQTKVWTFFDPRPEFTPINTLKEVAAGQVIWVNVANDKTITFCGRSTAFFKGWNQVPC